MPRFFVLPEAVGEDVVTLTGNDAKHISRSLRMTRGEPIIICDGGGTDYHCKILSVSPELVQAEIINKNNSSAEPETKITLFASLSKGDSMEFTIQKSVELGVCRIVPLLSDRCVVKPKGSLKNERWNKISEEAAKQSGRGIIPEVAAIVTFNELLVDAQGFELAILFYENAGDMPLRRALSGGSYKNIAIITGPEGGFEPHEVSEAERAGILIASLGKRILRCETAPLCAVSAILYNSGDI